MFTYNLEYRENILFIRLIGKLNNKTIKVLNGELENIINNLGIYNIVFNLSELVSINTQSVDCLVYWYEQLKNKKGVSLVCGVNANIKKTNLLNYIKEISSELCAIRVINWNN